MIYAEHDFTSNFMNAVGYDDKFMVKEIMVDELARLIVEDKKDIVKLLRNEGIGAKLTDNNQIIAKYILQEIRKSNSNIINSIAQMIAKNKFDKKIAFDTILNAKGDWKKRRAEKKAARQSKRSERQASQGEKEKSAFWQKIKDASTSEGVQNEASKMIANALSRTYSKKSSQTEQDLDERLRINEMKSATKKRKKLKTWQKIAVVGGIVSISGVILLLIIRKTKSSE